jgi:biotin carboxyl carrier protein
MGGIMNNYVVNINNKRKKHVLLNNSSARVDEKQIAYEILSKNKNQIIVKIDGRIYNVVYACKGSGKIQMLANGQNFDLEVLTDLQNRAREYQAEKRKNSGETLVNASMPGLLLKLNVQEGDAVKEGDTLFVLEAMKMENEIKAEVPGTVKEIKVSEGQSVEKGAVILIIE